MALLIFTSKVTNNDKGLMNCADNTEDYSDHHYISMHMWKNILKPRKCLKSILSKWCLVVFRCKRKYTKSDTCNFYFLASSSEKKASSLCAF